MTIVIEDISQTEQLDREALMATRGGIATITAPSPWEACMPQFPAFPSGFPFDGCGLAIYPKPEIQVTNPQQDPRLQ
jgi:hypothetical protein